MKRVLFLIPNFGYGGAQKVLADHSKLLKGKAEVLEVVFNDWEEKRVYETGHPYESMQIGGGGSIVQRVQNFFRRVQKLRQIKQEFKPDITISHLEGADYVSILSGGTDKKVIVIHGTKTGDKEISGFIGVIRRRGLIPWLYKKANRIITVSKALREELIRDYGISSRKITAAPNFFDCAAIAQKASQPVDAKWDPIFQQSSFKLITFGRLAPPKNMQALFPIFRELRRQGLTVQLYILGDGELREELLSGAREVSDKVWTAWDDAPPTPDAEIYFLGYQSAPHPFLKHADLYLMTSLWEGFPMALCEAMASGVAVAAADCHSGPAEILESPVGVVNANLNGLLLPMLPHQAKGEVLNIWVNAILALSSNKQLKEAIKNNGGKRILRYDEHAVGPEWVAAYLQWSAVGTL